MTNWVGVRDTGIGSRGLQESREKITDLVGTQVEV